ncbi:MAG: hypothetical protein IJW86_08000 [Clostridia bacterium]|nr:hypothetical protein [Clostridia bacterium]
MISQKGKNAAFDVALVALMVAVIEVCKFAMIGLPNISLTAFWLVLFSKHFGNKVYYVVPVFTLLEGIVFGFNLWWISYLYAWPVLVLITRIFRHNDSAVIWAVISGIFGLSFGALCAIPYIFTAVDLKSGLAYAVSWWISGIPWDITHCVGNFVLMMLLYKPLGSVMQNLQKQIKH